MADIGGVLSDVSVECLRKDNQNRHPHAASAFGKWDRYAFKGIELDALVELEI